MPTFLHTADVHLDTVFSAHFEVNQAKLRRNEMMRCFSDMVDKAKNLDMLLIAGDLFDGENVSYETISFLKRKFAEIPKTHVFIVAGNHDPYKPNSVYARENFGDNVHVFGCEPECVEVPEIKTRVWGASFSDVSSDVASRFLKIDKVDGVTDIILMHADLTSSGAESPYNPIDNAFVENCGADYLALGHIHKRSEIKRLGNTYYAYSGCPEGRGFDECGDMGCYIGSVDFGMVNADFDKTSVRCMYKIECDVSGLDDSLKISDSVTKKITSIGNENDIYKIILKGGIDKETFDFEVVKNEIENRVYYAEVYDETKMNIDINSPEFENNLCGKFAALMTQKIAESDADEKKIVERALELGAKALLGGKLI